MSDEERKMRAYAGLAFLAFEALLSGKPDGAVTLIGVLARYLCADVDIKIDDYSGSQMTRLQEEALVYLVSNPLEQG